MATRTVIKPKLWLDEHELSPLLMSFDLGASVNLVNATTLADGSMRRAPGVRDHGIGASGYLNTTPALIAAAEALEGEVGRSGVSVWTVAPTTDPQVGDAAYLLSPRAGEVNAMQGAHGDTSKIDISGEADGPLARGTLLLDEAIDEDSGQTANDQTDNTGWVPVHGGGDLVVHLHVFSDIGGGTRTMRVRRATSAAGAGATGVFSRFNVAGAYDPPFARRAVVEAAPAQLWVQLDWDVGSAAGEIVAVFAAGRTG